MRMPKAAPGEGPKKTGDKFVHWKGIAGGQRHFAYIAGPCHWVIGHPSDLGSKPCLTWATKSALPCRFCFAGKCPCEFGYLPVYRAQDYKPMFVIVYSEEREWVEQCKLHKRVQIGREYEAGARLWVRLATNQEPEFQTTLPYRKCAQELEDSLLAVWGMPELVAFLKCGTSDNALSLAKPEPLTSTGEKFGPMTKAAAQKYAPPDDDQRLVGGSVDAIQQRLAMNSETLKPSSNGHHKKPK